MSHDGAPFSAPKVCPITLAMIFSISGLVSAVVLASSLGNTAGAEIHDNTVSFPGATALHFNVSHFGITGGQPYKGTTTQGNVVHIQAGRKGSAGPAADFGAGVCSVSLDPLHPPLVPM